MGPTWRFLVLELISSSCITILENSGKSTGQNYVFAKYDEPQSSKWLRTDHSVVRHRYRPIRLLITRKYWERDRLNGKIDEEITENESRYQKGELLWWRGGRSESNSGER